MQLECAFEMAHCIKHLWIDKKNQQKYDPILLDLFLSPNAI